MASISKTKKVSKRVSSPGSGISSKRKKPGTPSSTSTESEQQTAPASCDSPVPETPTQEPEKPPLVFKDANFVHSSKESAGNKKTRTWKNLRQIVAAEKALPWKGDAALYGTLDAPPSFKPSKKYSDITGLAANYTDPHTKIRYATTEEFARIKMLPSDLVGGYLSLRKANTPVP